MTTFFVDSNSCTGCGICKSVCTMSIINQEPGQPPSIDADGAGMCFQCGHCEAFCPTQALRLNFRPDEREVLPAGAGNISPDDLGYYMKKRRSVRHFIRESLPRQRIVELLDIARYAASAGNGQPVNWMVVYDSEKVRTIAGLTIEWMKTLVNSGHPMSGYAPTLIREWEAGIDVICLGAPHLLIAHVPAGNQIAFNDAVIAMTHVDIAAPAFGIGTCWAGFVAMAAASCEPLQKELSIPSGRRFAFAMMLGKPKYAVFGIPRRKPLTVEWV